MKEKEIENYLSVGAIVFLVAGVITFFYREAVSYLILAFFGLDLLAILTAKTYFRTQHHLDKIDETVHQVTNENRKLLDNFKAESIKQSKILHEKLDRQKNDSEKFYWYFVKENRAVHLQNLAPNLFEAKSVLYIGARIDRADFLANFLNSGCEVTLLEIHKPNVDYFRTVSGITEVIEGDVTKFESEKKFDVVFWWHGPEHIEKSKLAETLAKLESMATKTIILGCPWGAVPQGANFVTENPYEKHVSYFDLGEFEKLGYKTDYSGLKDNPGSNIIAIKSKR